MKATVHVARSRPGRQMGVGIAGSRPTHSDSATATTCASSSRIALARALRVSLPSIVSTEALARGRKFDVRALSAISRWASRRNVSIGATLGSRCRKASRRTRDPLRRDQRTCPPCGENN
jgi:hypothetical protein